MTGSHPTPSNGDPATPGPDPLDMTPGEKVAAEWEARHDVRARGSHGNPAAVQEYLRHARSEEHRQPAQHPHPAAQAPAPAPAPVPAAETTPKTSWLRRLFHPRGS